MSEHFVFINQQRVSIREPSSLAILTSTDTNELLHIEYHGIAIRTIGTIFSYWFIFQ